MLTDGQGRRLWIVDEFGRHSPVKDPADILSRRRGQDEPDWWLAAKDRDWTPPEAKSLLGLAGTAAADGGTADNAAGRTKIGAGHKPQPYDEQGRYLGTAGALGRMAEGVGQALRQGAAAAKTALTRAAHELRTNEELHKGVEFGARAAAEVSRDVFMKAGEDAAGALLSASSFYKLGEPAKAVVSGAIRDMGLGAVQNVLEFPEQAKNLGKRLETVKMEIYGKQ